MYETQTLVKVMVGTFTIRHQPAALGAIQAYVCIRPWAAQSSHTTVQYGLGLYARYSTHHCQCMIIGYRSHSAI